MFNCTFFYKGYFLLNIVSENLTEFQRTFFYKLNLKVYVESSYDNTIVFRKDFSYLRLKKLLNTFDLNAQRYGVTYTLDESVVNFLKEKELHINERYKLGAELKHHDDKLLERFLKYQSIVNSLMIRKLRERQMWDSFFMFAMQKSGNFSVPGSGKTASALGVFAYLYKTEKVKRIVVICPKNAFGSWVDEFELCFGSNIPLQTFLLHNQSYKKTQDKKNAILFDSGHANLIMFNYESLKTYINEICQIIDDETLLIFDEVHRVKRVNGEYAVNALRIAEYSNFTIAMTGTPIPNTYQDIYNFLHILFPNEYDDFFGFDMNTLKKPSPEMVQDINGKIQPFFCRTNKNQLNVPIPNSDLIDFFNCTETENGIFSILLKKYRKNKLALFIRILQLETNPSLLLEALDLSEFAHILDIDEKDINKIDFVDYSDEIQKLIKSISVTTKYKRTISQVQQIVNSNKPVIIWCILKDSIRRLAKGLKAVGINAKCIYGEVELDERQTLLNEFRNNEFDVLITNPHTLAESVSLHTVCHDAVYYEYSYNLVHLLQSKDRIHRLGLPQNQYTQYYYLQQNYLTPDGDFSMDKKVYDRLLEKEQIMLNAIDNEILETMPTSDEELEMIFKDFDRDY